MQIESFFVTAMRKMHSSELDAFDRKTPKNAQKAFYGRNMWDFIPPKTQHVDAQKTLIFGHFLAKKVLQNPQ